jgi:class 3 adenylate cyclase/tetratricopeptide (TPR) repeat protein
MTDAQRIRILFLAASPGSMGQVNAGREAREIRETLRATAHRDSIELVERFAVRPGDLQRTFFEVRPHIVHFSGHGTTDEEIVLENDEGGAEPLGKRVLADLFRVHKDQVRVVVLNACHSRPQVEAISEHIECAIGMRRAIGSRAATEFSAAFYLAIGFGSSVQKAFESAIAQLRARGIPEDRTPQLVLRAGTDASQVVLIGSSSPPEVGLPLAAGAGMQIPSAALSELVEPGAPAEPNPASPASQAPSEPMGRGENRICTVMIIDLSSVAVLSARLDPSEVKDLLDRCQRAAAEPIEALGGYVDRRGGDGAIGVFGASRADEGDAERAVHAAIRLQAALAKIALPRGARAQKPSARVGISTGRVFAEVAGGTRGRGFTVTGEAVTAASRLQQAAALGEILIGRDTSRQIAGRFNVEPLPPVAALGQGEPIAAFRVLGPVPVQHGLSPRDFHGLDTKLVGRGAERQRLLDALDALVQERRAAHITLVGPPGVGRSRMLSEIVSSMAALGPIFILSAGQGSALAMSTTYGLAAALIRDRFRIPEGAPPEVILRRLRRGVRWLRARIGRAERGAERPPVSDALRAPSAAAPSSHDLDDALIQIAGLLDTQKASPAPGRWITPDLDGSAMKNRLVAAVASLVRFAAGLAPVVVLCDDAQWVDDASLDLLDEIVFRVEDLPVLVVCAARPDLHERRPHWGEGKATHRRVDLAPLEHRHIEEMIRDRLRRARYLSPGFVRSVAERAEGNPFILDETLRFLMDAGVIEAPGDGGPWIVHELGLGALTLPTTVQGIVQARLDRLDPPARAFLARAAVVGKTFWESAVEHLLRSGRGRAARPPKTAEIIALLRERQLVRVRETTTFAGERERVFADSATHEVACETLPAQVRRPLHLLVAGWLKERVPGSAHAALLALHYDLGGDLRAATEAHERAAAHASSLGQNAEALRHLLRASEILDELQEEASGEAAPDVPWRDQVRVRLDLGDVLRCLGRLDEAEAAYAKARAGILAGDPEAPRWEARADFRMALSLKVRGSTAAARELVERALALAKEGGIPEETPAMYALLTFLYRREQRPAESWRICLEGLRVCRSLRRPDDRFREIEVRALLGLAAGLYTRKRWIAAERTYRQAARIAAVTGDLDLLGRALNGVAVVLFARREYAGSRASFLESLRVKQKAGDLHQIAVAYTNLAELANEIGEHAAALQHARRSARLSEQIHAESDLGEIYRNLGAALAGLGQVEAAIDACLHALQMAEKAGPLYLPGIVETLVKICERAVARAPQGLPAPAKVVEVDQVMMAMRERSFVDIALRARIDGLRALLAAPSA